MFINAFLLRWTNLCIWTLFLRRLRLFQNSIYSSKTC